jgi:hypothetical protein
MYTAGEFFILLFYSFLIPDQNHEHWWQGFKLVERYALVSKKIRIYPEHVPNKKCLCSVTSTQELRRQYSSLFLHLSNQ